MVSMKEIAKKCNVSVASVSKALNGYSDISEETRKFILKTASEMGYLPNSSARSRAKSDLPDAVGPTTATISCDGFAKVIA